MDDVYLKNYSKGYENFNNVNMYNNRSCYIPHNDNIPPMNYFQNSNIINYQSFPNLVNQYNYQNKQINSTNENNKMKIESDSDLIQELTGNFLEDNIEDTYSDEKTDKKEININLGKIIVEAIRLESFPLINIKDSNKYNLFIPENILNKGEFLTGIKEEKEINEIDMIDEDKIKVIIPDNYILELNDNIISQLNKIMNKKEINIYVKNNKLLLSNLIEILYEKCLNIISDIKRNIKNRVKKIKNINLSNQLLNIFKFHNELRKLYLLKLDKNLNKINEENEDDNSYVTYAQSHLENCGGKTFKCEICSKIFVNYQTLGGHMSKIHPNCSEKYKKQNDIRKKREGQRKMLDLVKEKLFLKYNLDYRVLKKNDEKEKIKSFIKSHQKEYEILRRKMYRQKALLTDE